MFKKTKFSGIDFHEKSISFATVTIERGLPVIQEVGQLELNENIIVGGRVEQSNMVIGTFKAALDKGGLSKNVHLTIPTTNILVRKITSLPDIGEHELGKILHFQIGESIHLPFENPIYDFVKIGSIVPSAMKKNKGDHLGIDKEAEELSLDELAKGIEEHIEGPKSEILLFATSKTLSQDLLDVCTSAGLKPITAEIRALALQRLLLHVHPDWLKETEMVIDVSEKSIDIHIFKQGRIEFSRMMSINRNEYLRPADNSLDEILLFQDNLRGNQEIVAATEDVFLVEDSYINEIALEIEKAQNFFRYSLNERESEFKRIIVTGEKANLIFEPLKSRIETTRLERIDYGPIMTQNGIEKDVLDSYSVVIGLAIRGNEKNNKIKKF